MIALERRMSASPIWIQLRDTFTGAVPRAPVDIRLERRIGTRWVPLDHRFRLSSGGDLAVIDLGRTREPALVGTFDVRVWVSAKGLVTEPEPVEVTITAWPPDAPNVPAGPTPCRLFPGPAYAFPPRTPVLSGTVVDAGGTGVKRAAVRVDETIGGTTVTEEVRTDATGAFRLPVRWSAGATTVAARKARPPQPPLTGSITVNVPADLSSIHQIVVS